VRSDRRRALLWLVCAGGAVTLGGGRLLGRALRRRGRVRFRAAHDLAPIPWIGHC